MAVLLETSLGSIVIDLIFHEVRRNVLAATGDRTGSGNHGDSIYGLLNEGANYFKDELRENINHDRVGIVAMANSGNPNTNASQFYITLGKHLDHLDGKYTIFGEVVDSESLSILDKFNEVGVDSCYRPQQNIQIQNVSIFHDPYDDPQGLENVVVPPLVEFKDGKIRLEDSYMFPSEQEIVEIAKVREAHSRAAMLEVIGDIPEAEIEPPKNILFVRSLHRLVDEEALQCIFRNATNIEIIRDHKTGESLCYGFMEFATQKDAERAYFKYQDVSINDQRIKVDFSQSTSKFWKRPRSYNFASTKSEHKRYKC